MGITLYCMILGYCPFIGDNLQDTYEKVFPFLSSLRLFLYHYYFIYFLTLSKFPLSTLRCFQIVNTPLYIPEELDPELKDLLRGLLCKGQFHDSRLRTSLSMALRISDKHM